MNNDENKDYVEEETNLEKVNFEERELEENEVVNEKTEFYFFVLSLYLSLPNIENTEKKSI